LSEEAGRKLSRQQKVVKILQGPEPRVEPVVDENQERAKEMEAPPRLGWGAGGLWLGTLSRQYATSAQVNAGRSGTALFLGGKAEGQLWLNREWFAELGLAFGFSSLSQTDLSTGMSTGLASISVTALQSRLSVGYTYFATPELTGPKGTLRLGYQSTAYSMPSSTTEYTGPCTTKGLFLGVGGDLPLRNGWGALVNFDFGFLNTVSASDFISSSAQSVSSVNFFLGGYYRWKPSLSLRMGLDITSQGADFTDGSTLTHKVTSIGPSLQYFF
jgi:hypothetical protein